MNTDSLRTVFAVLLAVLLGCASVGVADDDAELKVRGAGIYVLTTSGGTQLDVRFAFQAKTKDNGKVKGRFRQSLEFQGLPIEFHGRVTCLAVDPNNGRVWIGGVVTQNLSVHPAFTGEIHEPGKDVWFRVLDTGRGAADPDRSTFLGFEGGAGIITSEEYCAAQLWPDDNARTHPVSRGRIKLKLDD